MSEEKTQENKEADSQTQATTSKAGASSVPSQEELVKATITALRAEEKAQEQPPQDYVSKEEVERILSEQTARIAAALSGGAQEQQGIDPLTERLIRNPQDVLSAVHDLAVQNAEERYNARLSRMEEERRVAAELQSDRPDITGSKANATLLGKLFGLTAADKSPHDRMKEAISEYDRIMEDAGHGDAKKRVAKASSVESAGASHRAGSKEAKVSEAELFEKELTDRASRRDKIRQVA